MAEQLLTSQERLGSMELVRMTQRQTAEEMKLLLIASEE
jgi:hypothetical protein